MGLHGEDDVVACPGVSLVTDRLAARLGIHIIRGSMSTLTQYNMFISSENFSDEINKLLNKIPNDKTGQHTM